MLSLAMISKEIHLRIDQDEDSGVPTLTRSGVYEIIKAIFDIFGQALVEGESISIPKFGKFDVSVRGARMGRNPHTGEKIKIPEKLAVKFRPSSVLRARISEVDVSKIKKEEPEKKKAKKGNKKKKKK